MVLLAIASLIGTAVCQSSCETPQDDVSLLQQWTDFNLARADDKFPVSAEIVPPTIATPPQEQTSLLQPTLSLPQGYSVVSDTGNMQSSDLSNYPSQAQARTLQSSMLGETSSLDAATAGIERQLQQFRQASGGLSALESDSDTSSLKRTVEDLRRQAADQTQELASALNQQQISNNAVDHAKAQFQRQIVNEQQAHQSEQNAKASEQKAWKQLAEEELQNKALASKVQKAEENVKKMEEERQNFAKKLVQLEQQAEQVNIHEHKDWEVSLAQARQSETKAWDVAKAEAQKALSERKQKEILLSEARKELLSMKDDVSKVQADAQMALNKEVQKVNQKVAIVKQQVQFRLRND
jgi:hypothetical protein